MTEQRQKTQKAKKGQKERSVFPFLLPADVDLVQPGGRSGLLQFSELGVRAGRLLLELLQVNVNGVELGLGGRDGQVAAVPRQAHTPAGAGQVQLAVVDLRLLQLEVHHVGRLAHVHQQVPEDAAQDDAQQLQGDMGTWSYRGCQCVVYLIYSTHLFTRSLIYNACK